MKKIIFAFIIIFAGCSGEAGSLNNDAGNNNNNNINNTTCPQDQVCGLNCCDATEVCYLGQCKPPCETDYCRGICCDATDECVNDMQCLPVCENIRCGENLVDCCLTDQICLDGVVCAADCLINRAICGEDLNTCCQLNDVCLNNICITPGNSCTNNFDCPDDSWYCETTIGRCFPVPPGDICEGNPTFFNIEPELEWYWRGTTYLGKEYSDIMAAPTVGDVNGDGIPDIVVVAYYANSYNSDSIIAVLSGDGNGSFDGSLLFTIPSAADPTAPKPFSGGAVALANFDNDPGLELVYNLQGGGVRIVDNDGVGDVCDSSAYPGCNSTRKSGASFRHVYNGASIADLNHDGMPDVVLSCHAMNGHNIGDPSMDFVDVAGCGEEAVVADLNGDGLAEIVDAAHAITTGGTPFWTGNNGISSRFVAVADIFSTIPGPEVINIGASRFSIMDGQTGNVLVGAGGSLINQIFTIPGGGNGGPPTVADFDGDGLPEISSAGGAFYLVYDPDCWATSLRPFGVCSSNNTNFILWQMATKDLSSSMTGSSVFDFQGDGIAEVLYNDECFFHIYDGQTGQELVDPIIPGSSWTLAEYPLVADVDGDGNAEMIVISNKNNVAGLGCRALWKTAGVSIELLCDLTDCVAGVGCTGGVGGTCASADAQCDASGICQTPGGTMGVRVYGDANDMWVRTRNIWNQFSYHVTNIVFDNGEWVVPAYETQSWISYNNFRQNVQGGTLFPVPDLVVNFTATEICPTEIRLVAVVKNQGSAGVNPGVNVNFYRTDVLPNELLTTIPTTTTILPGGWERIVYVYEEPPIDINLTFSAVLDEESVIEECNNLNNSDDSEEIMCTSVE
jgi:FG-GAP repeat